MCSDTPTTDHSWWFAGRWWLIDLCSPQQIVFGCRNTLPTLTWPLKAERQRWSELFCTRNYCKKRLISPQNKPLQQLSKQQTPIYIMPHLIIYLMKITINNLKITQMHLSLFASPQGSSLLKLHPQYWSKRLNLMIWFWALSTFVLMSVGSTGSTPSPYFSWVSTSPFWSFIILTHAITAGSELQRWSLSPAPPRGLRSRSNLSGVVLFSDSCPRFKSPKWVSEPWKRSAIYGCWSVALHTEPSSFFSFPAGGIK